MFLYLLVVIRIGLFVLKISFSVFSFSGHSRQNAFSALQDILSQFR
ncbi:hypothetical protein BACFIN_05795 [Bacteroides finegoldii DSM 17565]|nr:hypothetical protein BACFIN_05795 [Bacteroides finegoldii DSM 17565]